MVKKVIIPFMSIFSTLYSAQIDKDVVGFYKVRGGNHYLKADHAFIMLGYATIVTGKWNLEKNGILNFIPDYEKEAFTLYGRNNPNMKGKSKIMLEYGFYDEETFIHFGALPSENITLKRIFAPNHHSFTFPYVYEMEKNLDEVSFSFIPYNQKEEQPNFMPEIYSFKNDKNYNDFVGIHTAITRYKQPFAYLFKDDKIYYNDDSYGIKEDLEEALEESQIAQYFNQDEFKSDKFYLTPKYKEMADEVYDESFNLNYVFDEKKNDYRNLLNYVEGQENDPETDYNNTNIFYIYTKMPYSKISKSKFKIIENSVFALPKSDEGSDGSERRSRN